MKRHIAYLALAVALAGSWSARAETLFLTCGQKTVVVDLTNLTVNNHPATINGTSADWIQGGRCEDCTTYNGDSGLLRSHLDLTTGSLTATVAYQRTDGTNNVIPSAPVTCTKTSAPKTKL